MEDLIKQRDELKRQLAILNDQIKQEEIKITLTNKILSKIKQLEDILAGEVLMKIHYPPEENELMITEYFEKEYADFKEYDPDYERILHYRKPKDLTSIVDNLDTAIHNHNMIKNKIKISSLLSTKSAYAFNFKNFVLDNAMEIEYKEEISTSLDEPFGVTIYSKVNFNKDNTVDLTITSTISYYQDIEKEYDKNINDIDFHVVYNEYGDNPLTTETFTCSVSNVEIKNIHDTLQKIKQVTFDNAHLVKLSRL